MGCRAVCVDAFEDSVHHTSAGPTEKPRIQPDWTWRVGPKLTVLHCNSVVFRHRTVTATQSVGPSQLHIPTDLDRHVDDHHHSAASALIRTHPTNTCMFLPWSYDEDWGGDDIHIYVTIFLFEIMNIHW